MVSVAWFRNAKFVAMNASGTLVYVGYFAVLFLLSLYLLLIPYPKSPGGIDGALG